MEREQQLQMKELRGKREFILKIMFLTVHCFTELNNTNRDDLPSGQRSHDLIVFGRHFHCILKDESADNIE
jgi:hypothetical protein